MENFLNLNNKLCDEDMRTGSPAQSATLIM